MKHTCHATACETAVPPKLFMCKPHWSKLPQIMRNAVWAHYQKGQEERKVAPTQAYFDVTRKAIKYIEQLEGIIRGQKPTMIKTGLDWENEEEAKRIDAIVAKKIETVVILDESVEVPDEEYDPTINESIRGGIWGTGGGRRHFFDNPCPRCGEQLSQSEIDGHYRRQNQVFGKIVQMICTPCRIKEKNDNLA